MLKAGNLMRYLAANQHVVAESVECLLEEFDDLKSESPTVIAFGGSAHLLAAKHLPANRYSRLVRVTHYSGNIPQTAYRERVLSELGCIGVFRNKRADRRSAGAVHPRTRSYVPSGRRSVCRPRATWHRPTTVRIAAAACRSDWPMYMRSTTASRCRSRETEHRGRSRCRVIRPISITLRGRIVAAPARVSADMIGHLLVTAAITVTPEWVICSRASPNEVMRQGPHLWDYQVGLSAEVAVHREAFSRNSVLSRRL